MKPKIVCRGTCPCQNGLPLHGEVVCNAPIGSIIAHLVYIISVANIFLGGSVCENREPT